MDFNFRWSFLILLGLVLQLIHSSSQSAHNPGQIYYGSISESAAENAPVFLTPDLMVRDRTNFAGGEVCGYTLYNIPSNFPFRVALHNRTTGAASIVRAPGYALNYRRQHVYEFQLSGHDCVRGNHSNRDYVTINVLRSLPLKKHVKSKDKNIKAREHIHFEMQNVNDASPKYSRDSYIVEVTEGRVYPNIVRLHPSASSSARPRTPDAFYSRQKISPHCSYHLITKDVPFKVSLNGDLTNTKPLDYHSHHNYILEVRADGCSKQYSGHSSEQLLVNIKVSEACRPGWHGVADQIDYSAEAQRAGGVRLIGSRAHLDLCDRSCHESHFSTKVQLSTTNAAGRECDRDRHSLAYQRALCHASEESVQLLPAGALHDRGEVTFDGTSTAIEVSPATFNHTITDRFTIATWMRHSGTPGNRKEHIICDSDGEKMNRHHYSLFIHNCRLVLLLRVEPSAGVDMNTFKPAEFRWKVPQVCDGRWHHYVVSAVNTQVQLHIDGKIFVRTSKNPEIIDDWPLHKAGKVHFTKLVVGACWHGGEQKLKHFFTGQLAGLSVLKGKTETDGVIKCLNNCREKLDFHAMQEMNAGMSVAFNNEMTEISISGHNRSEVERLLHHVGYMNARAYPAPGRRTLVLQTDVTCADGRHLEVPDRSTVVLVRAAEHPIITLSGPAMLARSGTEVARGVKILEHVAVLSQTKTDITNGITGSNPTHRLDWCSVRPAGDLFKLTHEHLTYPENLVTQLGLHVTFTKDGLRVSGTSLPGNYQRVLNQLHYVNQRPQSSISRKFSVVCSQLNGRYRSNQFTVKVDFLHDYPKVTEAEIKHTRTRVAQNKVAHANIDTISHEEAGLSAEARLISSHGAAHNVGTVFIVVICVGFLVVMIVLGVMRIRAAHQRTQVVTVDEKEEMEWDNTNLTIIVNPMEQQEFGMKSEHTPLQDDNSDSDDDVSMTHDDLDSSDEEVEKVKDREFEWDDSGLSLHATAKDWPGRGSKDHY